MQVFLDSNVNCSWLPGAISPLLHSSHSSPSCRWTKALAPHRGHCNIITSQLTFVLAVIFSCQINLDHIFLIFPLIVSNTKVLISMQAALTLATSAAAAATSIVYLAHNGNSNSNWLAICNQFGDFCQKVSGAVVASFITVVSFMFLILLSALALRKH